ncbi:MAG: hypothetical protein PHF15_15965 [Rhodoferax sp.]|nr:hypothetical protein [Rhodoferax sp.]
MEEFDWPKVGEFEVAIGDIEGSKAKDIPRINDWLQRVLDRPAVRRVFEREGLQQPWV